MLIICPSCATSYQVQPTSLPSFGQVRCLRCRTVWSPQLDQADKLLAAAAAIAADCGLRGELDPGEEGVEDADPAADILAPACRLELFIAAGICMEDPEPDSGLVDWSIAANPEADCSEDRRPDPGPNYAFVVTEDAAVNRGSDSWIFADSAAVDSEPDHAPIESEADHAPIVTEGASANLLPEFSIVADSLARDSQSDHAATCEQFAGPDVNVAPPPLAPPDEELQISESETPAPDQAICIVDDRTSPPDNLFDEDTGDERSAGLDVDLPEDEPSAAAGWSVALSEELGHAVLQFGAEDCCDDMEPSAEHGAAPGHLADRDYRKHPIDLRADYDERRFAKNADRIERRTASRLRDKAKVRSRGRHVSAWRFIPRWPLSNLHTGILALALVDVLLVGWRTDIVRKLPQTASFYALAGFPVNLRGLAFHGITTSTARDDGTPILVVEGNIINDTRKVVHVPQIRFVVRDAAAQEIYSWTASAARTSLPPGQAVAFRTRLASPPPGAHDVVLRFISRRDAVALIR